MIQFPETAQTEWLIAEEAANAETKIRQKIERGVRVEAEAEKLRIRHEAALLFQAELDAEDTPELVMMSLADYRANPSVAPADMIDGVLKDEGLCIVLGPSGSGKSTLALQMLHSLYSGTDFLGQSVIQTNGSFGLMSYDMPGAMMLDWIDGFPNVDQNKFSLVDAYKRGNPLAVVAQRKTIASAWRSMGVEVVVVDSFSASFFGHDQNDAAATMAHYRDLKKFALSECGAKALIVITHSTENKPGQARGSTVHQDVADSIVAVEGTQAEPRQVRMVKYRAARGQKQMNPVMIKAPNDVTHLVDVDPDEMTVRGMSIPNGYAATQFTELPEATDEPDLFDDYDDVEGEGL